jgi:succinate dehydrogenase/fumarate reductase flavoprotein subunit
VGIDDDAEQMFRYLMAGGDEPDEARARVYADGSVEHFDWLVALGVPFTDAIWSDRHSLQPTDACLIWSGNEKAFPFSEEARPAARGHKVAHEADAGHVLWAHLTAAVEKAEIRVVVDTPARELVVDEDGSVLGVVAQQYGKEIAFRARRGVVLCTGGFIMNDGMLAEHLPELQARISSMQRHGNPHDDGSGIQLGLSAGGDAIHMSEMFVTTPWYPPSSLTFGIAVNAQGQRFINEDCYHGRVAGAVFDQPDGVAYLIADEACFGYPEHGVELAATEARIEDLEAALAMPTGSLTRTLSDYNKHASQYQDPAFRKHPDWLTPLNRGPYAALDISVGRATYYAFTLGGLHALPSGAVLRSDGSAVPGLFAAGANTAGIPRSAGTYCSGQSIGDATFFGRRAGRAASGATPKEVTPVRGSGS